jgi:hypothetical protein
LAGGKAVRETAASHPPGGLAQQHREEIPAGPP